ncbi:recombinase family protein [Methylocystis sp. H62]|uniref:recombinase family protein n=1 Tax=Methylocystis sp. H62 TaxID=2785789 RepID=UPI001FEE1C5B|nr:recombinase family protein [Methylocystis sp. H62]
MLGWSDIEIIDDDLGSSAAGGAERAGLERMVAQVCLGKAGAVCAREVSRFARNSRDWQQPIELCRVVERSNARTESAETDFVNGLIRTTRLRNSPKTLNTFLAVAI